MFYLFFRAMKVSDAESPNSRSDQEDVAKSDDSLLTASHFNRHTPIAPRHRSWHPEFGCSGDLKSSPGSILSFEESQVVPQFLGRQLEYGFL